MFLLYPRRIHYQKDICGFIGVMGFTRLIKLLSLLYLVFAVFIRLQMY